jgi:hypothetical protein
LETLIVTVFCHPDDALLTALDGKSVRHRGPLPLLSDAQVLTMETLAQDLGMEQDKAICACFRRHFSHFFPHLRGLQRTTFARQAANLWRVKERLWQHL